MTRRPQQSKWRLHQRANSSAEPPSRNSQKVPDAPTNPQFGSSRWMCPCLVHQVRVPIHAHSQVKQRRRQDRSSTSRDEAEYTFAWGAIESGLLYLCTRLSKLALTVSDAPVHFRHSRLVVYQLDFPSHIIPDSFPTFSLSLLSCQYFGYAPCALLTVSLEEYPLLEVLALYYAFPADSSTYLLSHTSL